MSPKERASLGFGDELESLDPAGWAKPKPAASKPAPEVARRAAKAAGFRSCEAAKADPEPVKARRRRTGRTAQLNLKPETIEAFTRIADAKGWGLVEAFERATALLQQDQTSR